MSAPPAPKRFAIARAPHLCLEVRDEAVYWALAKATRAGMRPVDWGRIDLDEAARGDRDAFLAALAASGAGGYADVEIALRSPRLATERLDLPPLSRAEARAVAARRLGELAARIDADAASAFSVASGRDGALHAWLTAVPRIESAACHATWQDRGFSLTRIQSRHLALGQLVHHLDHEFAEGELVAIFDLEAKSGTCVVADRAGWVFSREVPLRFMGRSVHARTEPEVEDRPHAVEPSAELRLAPLDGDDDAPSGLELATPLGASSAHTGDGGDERDDALAEVAMQTERLATELRRTFRYVQGQLDARPVARVFLSGEITELV
ncbi:MAG: hypothetical protein KC560_16820, partial [Myxococcales bacterium]|nr:hypothetical protein [Myxococcales bacterium]